MIKHLHRRTAHAPKEAARLRGVRGKCQSDKPNPKQFLQDGGPANFVRLSDFITIQQMMNVLKNERESQKMTLANLSDLTGIDQAALSRLENGRNTNPTFETVFRIAFALKKVVLFSIQDASPSPDANKQYAQT